MNATSAYDILYRGMSPEDREKLTADISDILKESAVQPLESMKDAFRKIAEECYSNVIVNPWPDWLSENGGSYGFVSALADHIWNSMMKSKPSKIGEWKMRELFRAMMEQHPEEIRELCDAELVRENAEIRKQYEFELSCNRDRRGDF